MFSIVSRIQEATGHWSECSVHQTVSYRLTYNVKCFFGKFLQLTFFCCHGVIRNIDIDYYTESKFHLSLKPFSVATCLWI